MTRITTGTIHAFTYKEGLLSPVAHDLRLDLGRFQIDVDGDEVRGTFWPDSLTVAGAMRDGRLDPTALKPKDTREIVGNIQQKILHTRQFPEVRFEGRRDGASCTGTLTLCGRSQPLSFAVGAGDGALRGRVTLVPSRFGIPPFKALLGAIKLKDAVDIVFDLPAGGP